ncbi:hypothetical protein DBR17_01945 [Sphingomonas sp. HMWF008]|nr:hypothetical protein DBR17_01945 [Sphingomonas sp. HMWF008]
MILALLLQAVAAPPVPWAVTTKVDAASKATTSSAWSADNKARLVVRCDVTNEKIVSIQFIPKPGFVAALPRPVSIKADEDGWLGTNWQFPGTGAFISQDVIVTNLAQVIAHGKTIHVRVIDPDNAVVEASFAGPGEAPIRQVLKACEYELGVIPPRSAPPPVAPKAPTPPDPDAEE